MLGFVPKWKALDGHAQVIRPDITPGFMRKAPQGEVEEMEERPEKLLFERMMGKKGKNIELVWSDHYRKITRRRRGTHKPPDRISKAESNDPSLFVL